MKQSYNNNSLAFLGHGKWKSALRHTLLIIGLVLMSMGAYAQTTPTPYMPEGLVMKKTWEATNASGTKGNIFVEAFVTGHSVDTHVPTDIVLVLDVSGSMDEHLYDTVPTPDGGWTYNNYGTNTYYYLYNGTYYQVSRTTTGNGNNRRYCLTFTVNNGYFDQTYYLTGNSQTTQTSGATTQTGVIYTGVLFSQGQTKMEALQASVSEFVDIIATDATNYRVDHRISVVKYGIPNYYGSESSIEEGNHTTNSYTYQNQTYSGTFNYTEVVINRKDPRTEAGNIKNTVNALVAGGSTAADYGMSKARYLLASIPANEFEERSKVVVMFTDGEPTYTNSFNNTVANNTISNAHDLKNSWTNGGNTYNFNATVFSVGVFDNETTNIRTYMNRVSSNYPAATSMTNNCTQESDEYYFKAESAGGLTEIFKQIAGASGAMSLPAAAIVQDVVSPSFHLNVASSGPVTAYAPKLLSCNEATGVYTFEELKEGNLELTDGIVTGGSENKLPSNFLTVNGSTIQMSGFNFSEHWCGTEEDPVTHVQTIHGRKIVIKIPVEVNEGLWGDGMETNDNEHSYIQNGNEYYGPFNTLTADVQGEVWTEVVVEQPETFTTTTIDGKTYYELHNPEDLAWFISQVNGRLKYEQPYNTNAPEWNANAILLADIDMSAHNWVPIGSGSGHGVGGYTGTFDGNGHVITGLKNNASKYYKMETTEHPDGIAIVFPGMFSKVGNGGVVKNVFVLDTDFRGKHHTADFVHHGIIADTLLSGGQIFNCEAAGRLTCNNDDPSADANLIFGGLVGLNQGTIHSCMAMAEITGYTMGGMIGENKNSFSNGFTNGVYNYIGTTQNSPVGGIAGNNTGTINNCYVRFQRNNTNLNKTTAFGMIYGSNTGTVSNYYTPQIVTWSRPDVQSNTTEVTTNLTVPIGTILHPTDNPTNSYTLSVSPTFFNMFTNDNMTEGSWGTLGDYNVYTGTPLLTKLNANKGNGASWKRTSAGAYTAGAGNINEDYPVLQFDDYTCLASADGIRIDYAASLNEMLHRHNNGNMNENTQLSNKYTQSDPDYYQVTEHEAIYKGTINLYANDAVALPTTGGKDGVADNCTADGVVVYIDEDISLLQDATSSIEAYTAQTLKSFVRTQEKKERWHYVSSSLQNSVFGWTYGHDALHTWDEDPCEILLEQEDEDHALFPIDLITYKRFDFYCFYEPQYHWINFKRNSNSHFHMDNWDANTPIVYTNETQFTKGKGYLMAIHADYWHSYGKDAQFIQNRGTLNNGTVTIPVTYTAENEWTELAGYNLLGNPYQSYLDFTTFAWANSSLWDKAADMTFAVYDPQTDSYVQGVAGEQPSQGALAASGDINMHQGFLIRIGKGKSGNATFDNTMRSNTAVAGTHFRGEQPAYPLINFILTDNNENTDIAVLELNRPENSGALKLRAGNPNGRIYFRHDNTNMAIFFRDNANGYQSLNFAAEEDGNFTLNWNTANAEFKSLTLVDNVTGIKTDMLTHDHYTFEGRVSDYNSRFKIVFGEMDNNEEEPVLEHFAFFDHGNLIVNGTGHFEVVDVLGRVVYNAELTDTQNTISLPSNVRGVCMLCFTRNNETKVQKMVIQ